MTNAQIYKYISKKNNNVFSDFARFMGLSRQGLYCRLQKETISCYEHYKNWLVYVAKTRGIPVVPSKKRSEQAKKRWERQNENKV